MLEWGSGLDDFPRGSEKSDRGVDSEESASAGRSEDAISTASRFGEINASVYIALRNRIYGPCTQGRPISVTPDDITFFRDRKSQKSEHDSACVISSATTLSVVFIALDEACELEVGRQNAHRVKRADPLSFTLDAAPSRDESRLRPRRPRRSDTVHRRLKGKTAQEQQHTMYYCKTMNES